MKNLYNTLLILSVFAVLSTTSSCKKDNNDLKGSGPVTFHFDNRFGSDDLVMGTNYTNQSGEQLAISTFNYYVSNFVLVKSDGTEYTVPKDNCYHLVREGVDSTYELEIENVPAGSYTALKFIIGVDSLKNTAPVSERTGDLDVATSASDMYWTWNSGYIFYKIEGTSPAAPYDTMMGMSMFYYHIGGYGGYSSSTINNIQSVNLTAPEAAEVGEGKHPEFHIFADAKEVFDSPTPLSIAAHPGIMFDPFSTTISANYKDMFSINHVHND
ncbi:MAG: MbnP family protein [Chitinophagales bacterium]